MDFPGAIHVLMCGAEINNTVVNHHNRFEKNELRIVSRLERRKFILASTVGTAFEYYEFFLHGAMAANIGRNFFSSSGPTASYIFALLAFAAGFFIRPLGAVMFGRFGDRIGRKYTFLATVLIMGLATAAVGVLPSYDSIGLAAPIVLIILRMLQGLALGGEYGGAAVYMAEHAPQGRRNQFTSWLQFASSLGLIMSLVVVMACRAALSTEDFDNWGWRIPFLASLVILGVSVWLRASIKESPLFEQMRKAGKEAKSPLIESFAHTGNLKRIFVATFGICAGMAVICVVAQIYTLVFMTKVLKIDAQSASLVLTAAMLIGIPVYLVTGRVSDMIGRKPVIVIGGLAAMISLFPIFEGLTHYGNPALERAQASSPVYVLANPDECSFQFNPVGTSKFTSSCDVAKSALTARGIPYGNKKNDTGAIAQIQVGELVIKSYDATDREANKLSKQFEDSLDAALVGASYPTKADPGEINYFMLVMLTFALVVFSAITYAPTAAALVELFPTKIRYTSVSLPYHIALGWIGGPLPAIVVAIQSSTGGIYDGLWYPTIVIFVSILIAVLSLRESKDVDLNSIK